MGSIAQNSWATASWVAKEGFKKGMMSKVQIWRRKDWGWSSVVECLPSIYSALGCSPSTEKQKNKELKDE
jgi:hypothetical protein